MTVQEITAYGSELEGIKTRLTGIAREVLTKKGDIVQIPFEFGYKLGKISKKIKSLNNEINQPFINESRKLKEGDGKNYQKDYVKACEKTSTKEGKNFPLVFDQIVGLRVPECTKGKEADRIKDLENINDKYNGFIQANKKLNEEYTKRLEMEEKFEFIKLNKSDLPKGDILLPHEVELLMDILEIDEAPTSNKK